MSVMRRSVLERLAVASDATRQETTTNMKNGLKKSAPETTDASAISENRIDAAVPVSSLHPLFQ
ncbi:MAG: hypothetical protein ACQET5_14145 [Halobacteriota archaeon]